MKKESLDFLKELTDCMSPSGFEEEAVKIWSERTKKFVDEIKVDNLGSAIANLNEKGRPKIMFAGHIDEVGFMVKYISNGGYIYFSTVGGVDLHLVPGQRVWIKTKKEKILGVIGKNPIHLLEESERKKVAKIEQLWIDIGINDKKKVESIVDIGDPVVPAVGLVSLNDDIVISKGFDDKSGAFVISEILRNLSKKKLKSSIYGVATVQEEIGLRGARTSAYGVSPDIGIAIDVTFASDFPSVDKKKTGDIRIGKGPVIARGPNINPKIFNLFVQIAKKEKIPYQIESISRGTSTDANVIQLTKSGVLTGLVSIPNRYMHTPVELVSLKDLENTVKLLSVFVLRAEKEYKIK